MKFCRVFSSSTNKPIEIFVTTWPKSRRFNFVVNYQLILELWPTYCPIRWCKATYSSSKTMAHLWSSCSLTITLPSHCGTTNMIPTVQRRLTSRLSCFYLCLACRFKVEKYLRIPNLIEKKAFKGRKCRTLDRNHCNWSIIFVSIQMNKNFCIKFISQ